MAINIWEFKGVKKMKHADLYRQVHNYLVKWGWAEEEAKKAVSYYANRYNNGNAPQSRPNQPIGFLLSVRMYEDTPRLWWPNDWYKRFRTDDQYYTQLTLVNMAGEIFPLGFNKKTWYYCASTTDLARHIASNITGMKGKWREMPQLDGVYDRLIA